MSQQTPPQREPDSTQPAPAERRRAPTWIVVGLLVLLGAWFVFTQVYSRGGTPIEWEHDLAAAEQAARATGQRVFLVLYEPGCPDTEANERNLFSQRFVKKRLAGMVCCRVELRPTDPLRRRFQLDELPVMLVLEPGRAEPLGRLSGRVDRLQFETYVIP